MSIRFLLPRVAAACVVALALAPPTKADWAGLYIGGSIGWMGSELDWSWDIFQNVPPHEARHRSDTLAGGLHIGVQRQWGRIVAGLEGGFSFSHHAASSTELNTFQPGVHKDFDSKLNWLGSITPRVGWDFGRALAYLKGGYAFGQLELATYVSPHGELQTLSKRAMHGWTIGGGLEWKLREHVSLGLEYDFVRLLGQNRSGVEVGQTVESSHYLGDVDIHQVMLRLNVLIPHGAR